MKRELREEAVFGLQLASGKLANWQTRTIIQPMMRYCLIGPTYPYRGGIANYTTLLAQHLREADEVLLLSF